jgi:hypothetical protein
VTQPFNGSAPARHGIAAKSAAPNAGAMILCAKISLKCILIPTVECLNPGIPPDQIHTPKLTPTIPNQQVAKSQALNT